MRWLNSHTTSIRYDFLRGRGHQSPRQLLAVFAALVALLAVYFATLAQPVTAAQNGTLTFQARILTSGGRLIPDGYYNAEFKLYDVSSGGTALWTETYLNSVAGNDLQVKNGYLYANLGTITSFPSTINWDQELYLTLNLGNTNNSCTPFSSCSPDGEMSPRFKVTATPYAFKANSANNVQTNDTSTASTNSNGITIQTGNATGSTSNSGNITIDTGTATGTTGTITLGATNASGLTLGRTTGSTQTLLQAGSGGIQISTSANVNIGQADTNGTLLVLDVKTDAGDPAGTNGAMYYNQSAQKFRCFENGAWVDCIQGAPYTGTSATLVGGIQNVTSNQTALPLENMVFTSNTAVSTVGAVGGFTAPADGSFRSCLVMNVANITAGTLSLRWRVNGVSVGSAACVMNNTAPTNRESSTILNPGVVTFSAGDVIDIAFDTSATFAPTGTNDFTVYWGVEYVAGSGGSGSGGITLQDVYDQSLSASLQTSNNRDITFNLADTAIDSDFVVNVESGSTSRLVVQDNGTDTFTVDGAGNVTAAGGLTVGNSSSTTPGTIRWTGTDFEGYDGANWISLTSGGGGGGAGVNIVSRVKQANESVISNITPQDDNELTFPIGPNEEWSYRFVVQANAATAADLRFAVTAPTGATCFTATSEAENGASDGQVGCGTTSAILNGSGAPELYEITGTVKNGSTSGNVTLQWAQFTSNATNTIVYAGSYVQAVRSIGAGGNGQPFAQGGNSFGTTATLGTSDSEALSIVTNGVERLSVSSTGGLRVLGTTTSVGNILAEGSASGVTGTTTGTGTNTTTLTLTSDAFNVNDVVRINNAGQDYYTRITVDSGSGTYTVSPAITFEAGRTVERYTIQNLGATLTDYSTEANRFFQGYFLGGVVIGTGSTTISDGSINSTTTLELQRGGGDLVIGGNVSISGALTGDGSGLTNIDGSSVDGATIANLDASNISSGTLADARLSANVTLQGNTFNGANQLLQLNGSGGIPAVSGALITGLDANNITSGTLSDSRLSANVTKQGNTFNGASQLLQLNASGEIPALSGALITSLDAGNVSAGTLADGRLSTNVTLLSGTQSFSGLKTFSAGLTITAGQTLTLNGDGFTDLTGTGLTISSGALQLDTTYLDSNYAKVGGNTLGGLLTLGTTDANGISFVTGGTDKLRILSGGNVGIGNSNPGNKLNVNTPTTAVTATEMVITSTASGNKGLVIQGASSQSANFLEAQDNSGNAVAAIDSGGQLLLGRAGAATGTIVLGNSTNANMTTLASGVATGARNITLPDESGTICLSNSNNCGYIRIASGAFQTDASNNDTIAINKTSATGNLMVLQRSGTGVFTIANSGALQIRATSTTGLDIQNGSGTSIFTVDTSGNIVRVGSSTADATAVQLVLDTKNTTGDPITGINGGSYYNSADAKFRCFENNVWTDCMSNRVLGETTLAVAGNTITVSLSANVESLHCSISAKGRTAASLVYLRFNGDTGGTSYGWNTYSIVAAAVQDAQDASDSEIQLNGTTTGAIPFSADIKISNFSDTRKTIDWTAVGAEAIGTDMNRYSGGGTWNNTASQISSVTFVTSAGNFTAGSHAWCEGRNVR